MPVMEACFDYASRHPGSISVKEQRRRYSDGYRRFVVGLAGPGGLAESLSLEDLSRASRVPQGTLKGWLAPRPGPGGVPSPESQGEPNSKQPPEGTVSDPPQNEQAAGKLPEPMPAQPPWELPAPTAEMIRGTHLQLVVTLWLSWHGTFRDFCSMLRAEHRLTFGDTFIGDFLQLLGLRQRRPRMPVEAPWSSGTFRRHFPGAQWLGDGTSIAVYWNDQLFVFNVEVFLDSATDAVVGFDVSDSEDEEALRQAYRAGLETTGIPPIGCTLDNRPSNHSPGAVTALKGAIVVPATPGRGQAKAPVEGAFGLFQQAMPALDIAGRTPREMAQNALRLLLTSWFRGRNGRPRKRLGGLSPAAAYEASSPTPEEIQGVREWFLEEQRRQERARRTREARQDPVRLQLLIQGLEELGIPDPDRRLAVSLASFAREAIARGLATFRTKKELGTLPADVDPGRYLGGIIRNLNTRIELERFSTHVLEQRIRLRDLSLGPLNRAAEELRAELPVYGLPGAFLQHALDATFTIDFSFWAKATADALAALPPVARPPMYRDLCRKVAASFKSGRERRTDLVDRMAEAMANAA
jgi:transposase InsO family protein